METRAEKFFVILLGAFFLAGVIMTILTDEDFVFQVQIPLEIVLIDIGFVFLSWAGFAVSVIRTEARRPITG